MMTTFGKNLIESGQRPFGGMFTCHGTKIPKKLIDY